MRNKVKYTFLKDFVRNNSNLPNEMKHIKAGTEFIGFDELYYKTHITSNVVYALECGGIVKREIYK